MNKRKYNQKNKRNKRRRVDIKQEVKQEINQEVKQDIVSYSQEKESDQREENKQVKNDIYEKIIDDAIKLLDKKYERTIQLFDQKCERAIQLFDQKYEDAIRVLDQKYKDTYNHQKSKPLFDYKTLFDYKIFVFDLDNTLYLHNADYNYSLTYHKKVNKFLTYLKANGKILYIATHNKDPEIYLKKLDIKHLFNGVIYEHKNVNPHKKDMIRQILNEKMSYTISDILFFDDHNFNIKEVSSIGVKSILVEPLIGVNFDEIINVCGGE